MELLTTASLKELENYIKSHPEDSRIIDEFDSLADELHLQYVPVDYNFDLEQLNLSEPIDTFDRKDTDKKNMVLIYDGMRDLSPAQATDERLWSTLSLHHFSQYTKARWPIPQTQDSEKIARHIIDHWLCDSSVRTRIRNNSISRLWWMGHIVTGINELPIDVTSEILLNNSDYRASLLERSTSASSHNAVLAILAITREAFLQDIEFNRNSFRNFMKQVNFHAGRSNFAAMSVEQLIDLLRPIYLKAYGITPEKKLLSATNIS